MLYRGREAAEKILIQEAIVIRQEELFISFGTLELNYLLSFGTLETD
jgi:hypothetical protein